MLKKSSMEKKHKIMQYMRLYKFDSMHFGPECNKKFHAVGNRLIFFVKKDE